MAACAADQLSTTMDNVNETLAQGIRDGRTNTTWADAYYFTVITLTTIDYGDMGPTLPLTRIFTTFYVFAGLGIIADLISETVVEDATQR